ncbi:unnamed protein product [Schistosoma mattheei]|uniref:Uncharacterized protein n=1 Tax=Schistosoma mattheei TaxID=31246 RepID=A0A3P8KZ76_9TREM|nr:unnamed protein product [Schistosoma mattheei]
MHFRITCRALHMFVDDLLGINLSPSHSCTVGIFLMEELGVLLEELLESSETRPL